MSRIISTFVFVFWSIVGFSQTGPLDTLFVLQAKYQSFFSVDDTTYSGIALITNDQLGQGYHGLMVNVGDVAGDQNGRLYRIDSILQASRNKIVFECVELQSSVSGPFQKGWIMRSAPDGLLPTLPINGDGVTPALAARIYNNNISRVRSMVADSINSVRSEIGETVIINRDSLPEKTYATNTRLIIKEDGYQYKVNSDSVYGVDDVFVVSRTEGNYAIYDLEQVISQDHIESIEFADAASKRLVINQTINATGTNVYLNDLEVTFTKSGFIQGADTIFASGARILANSDQQLWSNTTVIRGDWNQDVGYLEWTIGSTRTNRTNNFRALTNVIEMGAEARVKGFEYEMETGGTSVYHITNQPEIKIVGEDGAAFTLYTRHSTSSRGAYIVDTLDGFNIWIENIVFETDEYQAGTYTNSQRYQFIRSMYDASAFPNVKPYADYVVFKNNTFNGDIRMLFFGTDGSIIDENELAGLGIRKLVVEGNITDQTGNTIRVSQVPFGTVDIKDNRSTNIREVFVRLTTSGLTAEESAVRGSLNYIINISNNKITGDEVVPNIASGSSLGYVLSEGGDLRVYDNIVDGIYVNDQGEEVWFVYGNSRTIDMRNNRIMNIFNPSHWLAGDPGSLSALRFKACPNVQVHNNTFGLTREGLRTAGLLDSTYNVAAISKDSFWYSLYSSDNNQISDDTTGTSILEISGNTFLSPIVNAEGSFAHQNVKFTNNNIVVDYFYQTYAAEAENICALFDFTEGPSATYTYDNRNLIQTGNTVTVKHSDCGAVEVFSTDQDLLDPGEADTVYQSIANGNTFVLDTSAYAYPIHFSDRVERTEKIISKNGAGVTWSGPFNEAQNPVTQTNSEYYFKVNKYRDYDTGVWAHLNNGDMELEYQQSVDTVLTVEGIPLNWRGRGQSDTIPPVIDIRLTTYDSIGLPLENHYRVAFAFSESNQATAFNGFMYWNGTSAVYQAVSSDNSYQITALYEENPNIRLVYSYELGTFSAFVNRYLRLYGEDLAGRVKLQIKMISFPFVSTVHSERADELEAYLTPKTALKTFPGNVTVNGELIFNDHRGYQYAKDTTTTQVSPIVHTGGDTTLMRLDLFTILRENLSPEIDSFLNRSDTVYYPDILDGEYMLRVNFNARTSTTDTYGVWVTDIGESLSGALFIDERSIRFPKGINVWNPISLAYPVFASQAAIDNGFKFWIYGPSDIDIEGLQIYFTKIRHP